MRTAVDPLVRYPHPRPADWPELNLAALDETLGHVFDLAGKAAAEAGRALDDDLDDLKVPGWDQSLFSNRYDEADNICGTSYCVAGWRAAQDGRVDEHLLLNASGFGSLDFDNYASERFGMEHPGEAWCLFDSGNQLSDLQAMHAALHAGRDITRPVSA